MATRPFRKRRDRSEILGGLQSGGGVVRNYGKMYAIRPLRNFKTNQCCHLISRIANRAFFLNDEEKTRFVERLWRVATFSCVEMLAYCFMSNHFHFYPTIKDPRKPKLRNIADDFVVPANGILVRKLLLDRKKNVLKEQLRVWGELRRHWAALDAACLRRAARTLRDTTR